MDDAALCALDEGVYGAALSATDRVTGRDAMDSVAMHQVESCREELLSVSPGRVPSRLHARNRLAALTAAVPATVSKRAVYHHRAVRDRVTHRYLHDLVALGGVVRLAECVPARAVVVDRTVALLTVPGLGGPAGQMAVVRDPAVLTWLVASFEQLWAESTPLLELTSAAQLETELAHTQAAILRMLADGEKDEAISRRLSISVRTCRRHIADYMAQVGASSRFQAGVIAATAGYLKSPSLGAP
jgi:DNA-binding CsgD family transcriptional regulator